MLNAAEKHLEFVNKGVETCLKKTKKKESDFPFGTKNLSYLITYVYFGMLAASFVEGSITEREGKEKAIDEIVDFFMNIKVG